MNGIRHLRLDEAQTTANRALAVRCLARLGLLDEGIKPVGRPSRATSWTPEDADE